MTVAALKQAVTTSPAPGNGDIVVSHRRWANEPRHRDNWSGSAA
jgi:hypothetical protein